MGESQVNGLIVMKYITCVDGCDNLHMLLFPFGLLIYN